MTRALVWLIVATLFVIVLMLYRSQPGDQLDVTPDAKRAIEDAEGR